MTMDVRGGDVHVGATERATMAMCAWRAIERVGTGWNVWGR
jgi:hypothetical protein